MRRSAGAGRHPPSGRALPGVPYTDAVLRTVGLAIATMLMATADWDPFSITNAVYLRFVLSAILGGIAKVVAYRKCVPQWCSQRESPTASGRCASPATR